MNKQVRRLLVVAFSSLGFVAGAVAAEYSMRIASPNAPPDPSMPDGQQIVAIPLQHFADTVMERSGGRIDVQIFWNGQLGKMENNVNLVQGGAVQAAIVTDAQISPYFRDIDALATPYLFVTRDVAFDVLDGEFGTWLSDQMASAANFRVVSWMENGGYRNFTANKPLTAAADLKGLKIRVQPSDIYMQIVESLGASPTPIPFADLYTALQTGVADGQENAFAAVRVARLEEVQKFMILDGHTYGIITLIMGEEWLQSLPEDMRTMVLEESATLAKSERELSLNGSTEDLAYLEESGMTIQELTPEQNAEFKELTQADALQLLEQSVDQETIDRLMTAVAAAEKKAAN